MNPLLIAPPEVWFPIKDGDAEARAFFDRHYSRKHYKDGRLPKLFVGPGEKMVLRTPDGTALWVWRKFKSGDSQTGLNCAVFRNEGKTLSSALILAAEERAWTRWPKQRCYTYVDPKKVQSKNPGYCYEVAGWRKCGVTKWNKLIIYEKYWDCRPSVPARGEEKP